MRVTFPSADPLDGRGEPMARGSALRVLEEAAELVGAVKEYEDLPGCPENPKNLALWRLQARNRVLDEAMDVHQALVDLLAGEFSDEQVAAAHWRCVARNREGGRP